MIYDPSHPLADEDGLRTDILDAMRRIKVPVLRWPGGCFVSSYHWKDAAGPQRKPLFDKAWRVEDPNTFGTDEYIRLCRKVGCEPYICTNAGTGTAEEMSDWAEYCNLESEGQYAKWRIENGNPQPYKVKYWSIGNENYGSWEIGAKCADEWGRLVREAAKMPGMWIRVWSCPRQRFRMWTGTSIFLRIAANIWTGCPYMNTGI